MNEFELIQNYFNWHLSDPTIELGIGDDAAVFDLDSGYQLVTTTDTLSEGVHFFKDTSPEDIAYKSLAVNLSDIAAMGATAKYFTLAITLPKLDETWLEHFSRSLKEASKKYNVSLIGGDTTRGALNITITMMGVVEKSKSIKRSGAKSGENIYVSGEIGDAALCLKKINEGQKPHKAEMIRLNKPIPRLELGIALKGIASSCVDISDGLEQDLFHIIKASKVGAMIDVQKLPLSHSMSKYIADNDDWSLAVCGGDDYELCFTASESLNSEIIKIAEICNIRVTKIGVINDSKKLKIEGYNGQGKSYQHF
ncbi:thiamine-phosphate kinase [Candidatus Pseudothioglobus sp. Uisw_050_01]|uniref:thiamine-phosphate kinase n=1 Tax=Candidatus Pseudothioglobus sp. Uisw_050_01 TaxID=3230997 RepID=UPI003A890431